MGNKLNNYSILKKPEAILFDTDNNLYNYYPANKAAEEAVCKKAKNLLGLEKKEFLFVYKKAKSEVKMNLDKNASSHSRLLYFQRMIELLGYKSQLLLSLDFEQTFWRTFLANAPLFPGVKETLLFFKNNNVPIAVVTDLTAHIQLRKLTYFGLEDTFDAVVTSEEVGIDKPNKKNFLLTFKKLNLKPDCYFWMIGDNPLSDIYGAKQFNSVTFQKIHNNVKIGEEKCAPDFVIKDYFSFLNKMKNVFK